MGLFSLVGSIIGGGKAKKASRKAEAAQIAAYEKGIAEQRRQFDETQANYKPLTDQLAPAVGGIAGLIGLSGPEAQAAALQGIQNSPELAAIIQNGEEAILANASATGGLRGGNTQDALSRYRGDSFAALIGQQLSRLGGVAGLATGATDSVAGLGAQTANNVTGLLGQQGQARAQGLLTRGGINAQLWNNAGSFVDGIAKSFIPGGGTLGKIFG